MKNFTKLICALLLTGPASTAFGMDYSSYLSKYPLPQLNRSECDNSTIAYWKVQGDALISTHGLRKQARSKLNRKLEDHIQKNALITLAYARLAKKSSHKELYPIWLFAGANASHIVGKSLKLNYKYVNNLPVSKDERLDFLSAQAFKQRSLGNQVAHGNQSVYRDIFWKFLSANICGVETTLRVLNQDRIKYHKEIMVWRHFAHSSMGMKDRSLKLAIDYVNIEQKLLQDVMYDSLSSRFANAFRMFNQFAYLELTMPNAPTFYSFDTYSKNYSRLRNNLADFNSRVTWMKYLIRSMTPFIEKLYKTNTSEKSFKRLERLNLVIIN